MPVRFNAKLLCLCLSAALTAVACGDGGAPDEAVDDPPSEGAPKESPPFGVPPGEEAPPADPESPLPPDAENPPLVAENPQDDPSLVHAFATASSCSALPGIPARPSRVKSVADFGAHPNDSVDDTDEIQKALDSLEPGEWLVFPPGRYLHNKSLKVKVANTVLWGEGATLHATNARDQAVWLQASGASVYRFTLTAVTSTRRTTPWESRIAIFGGSNPPRLLTGNVVRGNRIINGGAPGTSQANGASSAGIFVYRATKFLIAENTVVRTLSDGIHITSGSSYGKVLNNTVKETGDDMIAVVSYMGEPYMSASTIVSNLSARRARDLNHHITIAGNTVSGQYWGRGISVVGGENVLIERNTIDRPTHAAAVYLARETAYLTFGVRNVLVRNNTITNVQTTRPAYTAGGVSADASKAGHGAVEIYSFVFKDEAANSTLNNALAVQNIRVESNAIKTTRNGGIRLATGYGRTSSMTVRRADGSTFTRYYTGGKVGLIGLSSNSMSSIATSPIAINNKPSSSYNIACTGNTDEGKGTSSSLCSGSPPPVASSCSP
jgi:parallel beta-helix repeat protein